MRRLTVLVCAVAACAAAVVTLPAQAPAPAPLTLLSAQGRRPLPVVIVNGGDYLSLDELAAALGLTVRDDRVTGTTTVSLRSRSAVLTPDRTVVSAQGRLVSLAAPPLRHDGRLLVTPEFVTKVLGVVIDQRVEFRRAARLLVLGDLRVPRVVTRGEFAANAAQVTFEVSPATEATVTAASGQITVTFSADAIDAAIPTVPAQGLLQAIRGSDGAPTITLATGPRFATYRTATQAVDAGTSRLVIDLMATGAESLTRGAAAPAAAAGAVPPGSVAPLPAPGSLVGGLPFDPAAGEGGVRTVVLDPGHGGDANGTEGPGGTLEKAITLQVSRKVKALIESRLGLRVVMTREDDRTLDQDARAAIANNNRADLFVSIHANAAVRPTVKGAEVYYLSVDRADLESRRRVQDPAQALPQLGGGTRAIELILWETAQLRHLEQSAQLATLVEASLRARVEMSPRPVQQAPFRVLVGANMPAVLVELGYLSHPDEEKALTSGAYQDRIALALFDAISTFRERREKPAP
ncbi:MAG: N-acetylmuramoyl-L-alanine amidase [Acidobacteriota bacterium]